MVYAGRKWPSISKIKGPRPTLPAGRGMSHSGRAAALNRLFGDPEEDLAPPTLARGPWPRSWRMCSKRTVLRGPLPLIRRPSYESGNPKELHGRSKEECRNLFWGGGGPYGPTPGSWLLNQSAARPAGALQLAAHCRNLEAELKSGQSPASATVQAALPTHVRNVIREACRR